MPRVCTAGNPWPLALACLLSALASSCDPRAAEPSIAPDTNKPSGQSAPAKTTSTPRPPITQPTLAKRCVQETPDTPTRTVTGPVPAPGCPKDPGPVPNLPRKRIEIRGSSKGVLAVDAEVAQEDEERQRGLMYRTSLGEDEGMLFIFEIERELSFWMRNTCLPLDMIFISADGTIVNIEENTPTLTDENFESGCKARYVLETNAGWTRKNGVKAGMKVKLPKS